MQKCSQLKTKFFQTLGYSSVTQNLNKKNQLVTFTSAGYDEKSLEKYDYPDGSE